MLFPRVRAESMLACDCHSDASLWDVSTCAKERTRFQRHRYRSDLSPPSLPGFAHPQERRFRPRQRRCCPQQSRFPPKQRHFRFWRLWQSRCCTHGGQPCSHGLPRPHSRARLEGRWALQRGCVRTLGGGAQVAVCRQNSPASWRAGGAERHSAGARSRAFVHAEVPGFLCIVPTAQRLPPPAEKF